MEELNRSNSENWRQNDDLIHLKAKSEKLKLVEKMRTTRSSWKKGQASIEYCSTQASSRGCCSPPSSDTA